MFSMCQKTVQSTFHVLFAEGPHDKWCSWDSKPGSHAAESEVLYVTLPPWSCLHILFQTNEELFWGNLYCARACMCGRRLRLLLPT